MYQDTEKIAEALWDRSGDAVEVDPAQFEAMLRRAEPGWDPFDFPENYRWFLIRDFPVKELQVTLRELMKDARDPGQEKFQHDRIIELWKKGAPFWPVFVTATGIIADGYHRTAAHHTLGHKTVDVVVSVAAKREAYPLFHDEQWLEAFPKPSLSGRKEMPQESVFEYIVHFTAPFKDPRLAEMQFEDNLFLVKMTQDQADQVAASLKRLFDQGFIVHGYSVAPAEATRVTPMNLRERLSYYKQQGMRG